MSLGIRSSHKSSVNREWMWKEHFNRHMEELLLPSIFYPQPCLPVLSEVSEHMWDVHTGLGNRAEELWRAHTLLKWLSAAQGGYRRWILLQMTLDISVGNWNHPSKSLFCLQTVPQINSKLSQVSAMPHSLPLIPQSWVGDCKDNSTSPCPLWRALQKKARGNEQFWALGHNLQQILQTRIVNVQANQNHWPAQKSGRGGWEPNFRFIQWGERWRCWQWDEGCGCPVNPGKRPRWGCKEVLSFFIAGLCSPHRPILIFYALLKFYK